MNGGDPFAEAMTEALHIRPATVRQPARPRWFPEWRWRVMEALKTTLLSPGEAR